MNTIDFAVFCHLMRTLHYKAFGEPLGLLNYGKSKALSWFIFESTGAMLSYKTLLQYAKAAVEQQAEGINPSCITLAILVHYVEPASDHSAPGLAWYRYRGEQLRVGVTTPPVPQPTVP